MHKAVLALLLCGLMGTSTAFAFELNLPSDADALLRNARALANEPSQRPAAERAYRVALAAMGSSLAEAQKSCRENPAAVFDEFSDFLLAKPSNARVAEAQRWWGRARQARLSAALGEACLPAGEDVRSLTNNVPADGNPSTAVVHWVSSGGQLLTVLAYNGKQTWRVQALDEPRLRRLVSRWRRNLRGQRRGQARQAQWLSKQLLEPLQGLLAELSESQRQALTQLRIVPDDPLLDVPWAALQLPSNSDQPRYLGDAFALSVLPSLTRLPASAPPKPRVLFAGTPDIAIEQAEGVEAAPLPAAREEWRGIKKQFAAAQLMNRKVTKPRLLNTLARRDYSVLHLAVHGQLAADPSNSYVLLADGRLPLKSLGDLIRERRYSQQPLSLLVLSGCETALSGFSGADAEQGSRYGLAGVALQAGARSALASLWPVDDAATAELMTLFYANLNKQPAAKRLPVLALQAAQSQLRQQPGYDAPFYWAAFQMIGDWQ